MSRLKYIHHCQVRLMDCKSTAVVKFHAKASYMQHNISEACLKDAAGTTHMLSFLCMFYATSIAETENTGTWYIVLT
jgi:hypothetical protein